MIPLRTSLGLSEGVEPHGYSARRFLEELEKPNLLILDALEYGERLVVDDEFMRVVESKREEVRRRYGLKWVDGAWT